MASLRPPQFTIRQILASCMLLSLGLALPSILFRCSHDLAVAADAPAGSFDDFRFWIAGWPTCACLGAAVGVFLRRGWGAVWGAGWGAAVGTAFYPIAFCVLTVCRLAAKFSA
jgi:hypothetical protein